MGLAIAAAAFGSVPTVSAAAPAKQPSVHPPAYVPLLHHAAGSTPNVSAGVNPRDIVFNNMDYNGGPVMPSNTDYMVLWSPGGQSAYPPEFVHGVAQFFRDLAPDSGGN